MRPESYIRMYDARREATAPSVDPVKARGFIYAKVCGAEVRRPFVSRFSKRKRTMTCPSSTRHWSYADRQWVCGSCGSPWRYFERLSLRGEVQEPRVLSDEAEKRLAPIVDVGLAINRLLERDPWGGQLYLGWARGASEHLLAMAGAGGAFGPGAPFTWGYREVRKRIQAAGHVWREVLKEAGLPFEG